MSVGLKTQFLLCISLTGLILLRVQCMGVSHCTKFGLWIDPGFGRILIYLCNFLPCNAALVGAPLLAYYTPSFIECNQAYF